MQDQALRNLGFKVTTPRLRILKILEDKSTRHFSADHIYKQLADPGEEIGLATIYRVLAQFTAAGLVKQHHFEGDHSVFELNEGEHHDHMVCVKCNAVSEFLDTKIEERQKEIARTKDFHIIDHTLTLYGLCQHCSIFNNNK